MTDQLIDLLAEQAAQIEALKEALGDYQDWLERRMVELEII